MKQHQRGPHRFAAVPSLAICFLLLTTTSASAADMRKPLQWHPGIAAQELRDAPTIRIARGIRPADMATLRDEQIIETPSGKHLTVRKYRQFQQLLAAAKIRNAKMRPSLLAGIPGPTNAGTPPKPGETVQQMLARPATDTLRFPNGARASVAQLQKIAQNMEQHKVSLNHNNGSRSQPPGPPVIKISTKADVAKLSPSTPDSAVLETAKGTRVTAGALRAWGKQHNLKALPQANKGSQK
jgi:hypothetical protein